MKSRLLFIDNLKGLAIIGVILVHFSSQWSSHSDKLDVISSFGARCPQLFFIISSFLTWKSLNKMKVLDTFAFWRSRFLKLAPLYYITLVLSCLMLDQRAADIDLFNVLAHLFFLNGLFPTYINSIMGVEWYIADLALFYIMVPFLYKYIRSAKSSIIALAATFIVNICFTIITNYCLSSEIQDEIVLEMFFHTFCIINQLPILMMGIVLYYIIEIIDQKRMLRKKILIAYGFFVLIFLLIFMLFRLNKVWITSSFIAGLFLSWLFIFSHSIDKFNYDGFISKLGKHSYGIYCVHILIISIVIDLLHTHQYNNIFIWLFVVLCVIIVSYVIGRILEIITGIKN